MGSIETVSADCLFTAEWVIPYKIEIKRSAFGLNSPPSHRYHFPRPSNFCKQRDTSTDRAFPTLHFSRAGFKAGEVYEPKFCFFPRYFIVYARNISQYTPIARRHPNPGSRVRGFRHGDKSSKSSPRMPPERKKASSRGGGGSRPRKCGGLSPSGGGVASCSQRRTRRTFPPWRVNESA